MAGEGSRAERVSIGSTTGRADLQITINQTLQYSGDTAAMARGAASEILDVVTEAFRQQSRRLTYG
jgi:hypothetical protein